MKNELDFTFLFETMSQGVVYQKSDGKIVMANPAACKILGLTLEEILNNTQASSNWKVVKPDGTDFPNEEQPVYQCLVTGKPVPEVVMGIYHPIQERYIWILVGAQPIITEGKLNKDLVFVTFSDISERIQIQQELVQLNKLQSLLIKIANSYINLNADGLKHQIMESLAELGEFVQADRFYVFAYHEESLTVSNTYEWCREGIQAEIDNLQNIPVAPIEEWFQLFKKGLIYEQADVLALAQTDPIRQLLEPQGIKSIITLPILENGKCSGFIGIDSVRTKHTYSENEKMLLNVFAEMLGNAIEKINKAHQILESEKKYRQISENMSDMVWTSNLNLEITYISPSVEKIFGYTPTEYVALPIEKRFDVDSQLKIQDLLKDLIHHTQNPLPKPKTFQIEGVAIHKNGQAFHFTTNISQNFNELGELIGFIGVTRDVTPQKKAEIELKESQQRLQSLVQSQSNLVIRTDLQGRHTYWNKNFENEFGWMYDNKGLDLSDSMKSVCEYHHERVTEVVMNCIQNPGEIFQVEIDKPAKNGGVKTTMWDFVAITDDNNIPVEIQCMGVDITERIKMENALYKSEKRFSDIAQHSNTIIWEIDMHGMFTYVNQVVEDMWGYRPDELVGKLYYYDLHPPEGREEFKNASLPLLKTGVNINNLENPILCKNGKIVWVSTNATPVFDENGVMYGYIGGDNDITEKKLALEEAEKFRVITDQANYGSAITTMDGIVLYANTEMISMHGLTREEVIGNSLTIFHSQEQLPFVFEQIEKIKKDGGFTTIEVPHIHKDGSVVPTLMSAKVITNATGVPLFLSATALNISENKKQEAKIIEQNMRLNAILEAIPDYIFVSDGLGYYKEFYHSKSVTPDTPMVDLIGRNIREDFDEITSNLHLEKIAETLKTKSRVTYEYPKIENGLIRYYECRTAYMEDDKVLRFVRDITQRKESENEIKNLSLAIEQSPVAIVITDLEANITYASPAFYKMTGYNINETKGMNTRILSSGETPISVYKSLWDTILTGEIWSGEIINKRKDGTHYWESLAISPITNITGQVSGYLAIKEDITQRKKSEQEILKINQELEGKVKERTLELDQMNKDLRNEIEIRTIVEDHLQKAKTEAEKANLSKSEFLSRMSHELRTPMNSILGFAQLLEMGELNPSQQKGVNHILRSGKHLLNLINEVLDISRIESGKISISLEPVNVSRVLQEVMDSLGNYAASRKIEVQFNSQESAEVYVKADRQRLKQVLINLLNNALKYNKDGGKVTVGVKSFISGELNAKQVRISFQDTGLGISKENLNRIFHPFERIGAETTNLEGTGLGLAVVKQLTELMKGNVGVISDLGIGSNFWVDLPFSESNFLKSGPHTYEGETEDLKEKRHTGTILYIEDNISNIELVEQILLNKRPGISLVSHLFGLKTLDLAKKHQPNLIMLDLNLPDAHGSEILKQLKEDPETNEIPVIVLSADAMPGQIVELMKIGARNYLTKPFEIQTFLNELDKYFIE